MALKISNDPNLTKQPIHLLDACIFKNTQISYSVMFYFNNEIKILAHKIDMHQYWHTQDPAISKYRVCVIGESPSPLPEECGSYPENYGTPLLYWVPIIEDVPDHSTVRCDTASCSRCWDSQVMNGLKSLNSIFTCTTNDGDNFINFKIYLRF